VATSNIFLLKFVSISGLFATASATMASILGESRAVFSMARQRVIPCLLARISKNGVPINAVLINGVAVALIIIATKGDLQLRKKMPQASRTFKVPLYPFTPILGLIICFGLLF
jgi:APA family basic amino acid/polyamine antiporter